MATLGRFVEYVPVCPEVECGLPTPREAMRLVGDPDFPRLVAAKTAVDQTRKMQDWTRTKLEALEGMDLCGYICKKDSPSSGMERVKVYGETGIPAKVGVGMFTKAFRDRFPLVRVEEEGRLHDPKLRENFIESIFTLKRWRELLTGKPGLGGLVDFHTRNKLLLLAHSEKHYRAMGKLVAAGKTLPKQSLFEQYQAMVLEALNLKTSVMMVSSSPIIRSVLDW